MPGVKLSQPRCNQTYRDVLSCLSGVVALYGLIWFLGCCLPSEGALDSPQNLKVEVLDFHAKVEWEPGPRNPSNTKYENLIWELKDFSGGENWTTIKKCRSMLICDLDDFESYDELIKNYFIRVKAEWGQESSEYINSSSFQPYADTRFSPPSLNVKVQEGSIFAHIHHPVTKKVEGLKFDIYLYRNASGQKTKVREKISAEGAHLFHNLPPDRYCLRAAVHHDHKQQRNSTEFAEECVVFHPAVEWTPVRVALGVSLLLVLPVGLILIFVLRYLWPKYLKTPHALKVRHRESKLLQVNPDKTRAVAISLQTWGETDDYVLKHEEDNSSASSHKTGWTYIRDTSLLYCEEDDEEEEEDDDDDGDKCIGSLRHSAGYGVVPDSSDEVALVGSAPSHAAACVNENEEFDEHPSQYMERLMVGAQWQVHVPLDSVNSQAASSSESREFIEETAETPPNISSESLVSLEETAEIPPNSSSGYELRQIPPSSSSGYELRQIPPNSSSGYELRQIPSNSSSGYETRPLICDNSEDNQ